MAWIVAKADCNLMGIRQAGDCTDSLELTSHHKGCYIDISRWAHCHCGECIGGRVVNHFPLMHWYVLALEEDYQLPRSVQDDCEHHLY
eukprot:6457382-Amphidinium_carterae.1